MVKAKREQKAKKEANRQKSKNEEDGQQIGDVVSSQRSARCSRTRERHHRRNTTKQIAENGYGTDAVNSDE